MPRKATETDLQREIQLALSNGTSRLFRNQVGAAWMGAYVSGPGTSVLITHPRRVEVGLGPGSSDLIGLTQVKITPEMVGKTVAIFTGVEVKIPGASTAKERLAAQGAFIDMINSLGGRAGFAQSVDDAHKILHGH